MRVVEELAGMLGLDEQRGERIEGQDSVIDPGPPLPLEQDVELVRLEVPVPGARLARVEPPETRTKSSASSCLARSVLSTFIWFEGRQNASLELELDTPMLDT